MKMFKTPAEWIKRCDDVETWRYNEALCELRDSMPEDCQCSYSSNEIAEYIMKYEGGLSGIFEVYDLMLLCYDIEYFEINAE